MIPILDGAYNPDPRLRPKVWNRLPSWPMPPNGTVGISLAADDENTQQDLFFWTDPRMFAVNRKGPTAMGSLVYDMAGGGFIDTTRGARLQSALWVVKEPYGGANSLALNIHDTGCGDAKGGLVIELPYDAGTVSSDTRILAELSHHRGGFIVSGCPNDWHNRGQDADGRPINGAHISLHTNLYHKPTIDGPMLWEGPWLPGEDGDKVTLVHFSWDAAIRHYRWYSWKDTYTPDVPSPPTWGGGTPNGGGTTTGGNGGGGGGSTATPGSPPPIPPVGGGPGGPLGGLFGSSSNYTLNPELFQGLSPFPFNPNDPPVKPAQPSGGRNGSFPADPYTNDPDLFPPTYLEEENDFPPDFAPHPMPGSRGTTARVVPRLHEWRDGEVNRPFTASSKEFAASAFLGRPQMAALNMPDFRNWSTPNPRVAQAMDNVTPIVATFAAYGEQVGSQWVYNQRPRQSRYLGGTAQGGFVLLPPEVGIDSFGDSFQPTNIGTLSKPYMTMGPGARIGFGPPDLTDGTVDNGWSMSWLLNSEINLDAGALLRGNDFTLWRHASTPTPAFAILHSGANQGDIAWRSNTNFWGIFTHENTGNHVYTFPDVTGTVALTGSTVASITGTANQVLANGTSGSAEVGAVTLTTPQDIGTASDVLFKNLDLTAQLKIRSSSNQIILDSDAAVNIGTITMAALSAARAWTFPDATGTVVLGTGTANQLAYWGSTNGITGDAGLTYDATNDKLSLLNSSTNVTPMLEVEQASTGDTGARFTLTGGNSFMLGIDNSDSDKFKISYGSAGNAVLGTNDYLTILTDGEVVANQWLQVGTATDAAAQGDFAAGLTGAARLFYDQSVPQLSFYSAAGVEVWRMSSGQLLGPDGTAALPTFAPLGDPDTGWYSPSAGSNFLALSNGTTPVVNIGPSQFRVISTYAFGFAAGDPVGNALDTYLERAAAGIFTLTNQLRIGTATDTATSGDFVTGLTGAARLFYDQSIPSFALYNSGGTLVDRISQVASTETVFNDGGADIDHRIEGDNKTGCLTVDASDDEVVVDGRFSTPALTPSQITADQNDYNPESTATNRASFWRLSSDASRNITGIANGLDGRHLWLVNVGSSDIVIQHQNAGSTAANRIITQASADVTMGPNETMILIYDSTTARWRSFEDA